MWDLSLREVDKLTKRKEMNKLLRNSPNIFIDFIKITYLFPLNVYLG